jgi:3-oxoacyl-[acyl-carrier protein] reductase
MPNVSVTGGSRGLGLGIATTLRAAGHDVIAVARRESEALTDAMNAPTPNGGGALHFVPFDLGCIGELPRLVKHIRTTYGPIFGLVNNAGIGTSGVLATMRDADIEALLRLNTLSPLILTKYVARTMMAGQGGRIVNIASIVGFTGFSGLSVYSATKASLLGFTRSLARELGTLGVTVNAVAPGFVDTDMTKALPEAQRAALLEKIPLGRLGSPEDIANAVLFLASPQASYITGATLHVNGGMYMA